MRPALLKKWQGLSKDKPLSSFDQEALAAGTEVEYEHTKDRKLAARIAADHLTEDKDYYKKLAKMESGGCD